MALDSTVIRYPRQILTLWCCAWLLTAVVPCFAQDPSSISIEEQPIDLVMFHDPILKLADATPSFPAGIKELWLKAMNRPDSELQRLAADSFALAQQRGMKDLEETHSHLAELLKASGQDSTAQRAAVHTLVQLDARKYAELLAETANSQGLTTSLMVEPALARWKSDAMKETWLARIGNPRSSRAGRILAINGLGEITEGNAAGALKRIASDGRASANERVAAARALSKIQAPGLVGLAQALVETVPRPTLLNAVVAVELLEREDGQQAIALLSGFVSHASTAVQAAALQRLFAIDPKHIYRSAQTAIESQDTNVRKIGAKTLIVQERSELIAPLTTMLDDVNPTLRRHVAQALVQLAGKPELREEVIKQATAALNGDHWRSLEQATVVLVLLEHEPAGFRLVELLQHARGEVKVASGWGLRRLAVPAHLPAMLAAAQNIYEENRKGVLAIDAPGSEMQIAQLFMAFGKMRYMEAEPLLMRYVPKDLTLGTNSRAAAVWAVGLLNEGQAPQQLTATLIGRLNDVLSFELEENEVRRMSAVSIGRMKSKSAIESLRNRAANDGGYVKRACYWALEELTGEASPPPDPIRRSYLDWFLVPAQ